MKAIQYARQLIQIDSTSHRSNQRIARYLERKLTKIGFVVEKSEYLDGKGVRKFNIVARKGGGQRGLAYFCHSDVVPARRWFTKKFGPFEPVIARERLYGRGSCDMKGSIACMLAAARQIAWDDLEQPLYFVCTADEETGFEGAREVVRSSPLYREMVEHQTRAIIGEPTMLEVVHGHKGCYEIIATAKGKAAHSSGRAGHNANMDMIPFLAEMKSIHDLTLTDARFQNSSYDPPELSFNISLTDDRSAANVKAAKSTCVINFRPMPDVDHAPLLTRVQACADRHQIEVQLLDHGDPLWTPPESDFVAEALALTHRKQAKTAAYGTDGCMLSELHDKIVCGPGNIAQAHTKNEWIALEQLKLGTEMYLKMIQRWCF